MNRKVLTAMGLRDGVSHTEFILGDDGQVYFLETSARVGGANIVEVVEAATGVSLWREWARIETGAPGSYRLPEHQQQHAGIVITLAKQEWPDTSAYDDPEVVWRIDKRYHAGMIVRSSSPERVQQLLQGYSERFVHDFLAVLPPQETAHL
jgi:biotin carboxylase